MGNYHARFLGGKGAERLLPYPVGMKMKKILLILILFLMLLPSHVFGQEMTGSVCIAPVPMTNDRTMTLGNPSGGNRFLNFAVQIDHHPRVPVDHEKSVLMSGLALDEPHLVRISRDGKPFASFRFRFGEYKSKELCLWFKALYETWSLWENTPSAGCKCSR